VVCVGGFVCVYIHAYIYIYTERERESEREREKKKKRKNICPINVIDIRLVICLVLRIVRGLVQVSAFVASCLLK
jgi:hypothetical protein